MSEVLMDDVMKAIHRLPSLPTVVMELTATLEQEDVDVDTLAHKIAQDQVLTAKTLRLANSSFYGRTQSVNTMAEAIAVLGFRTVRSVVTTAGLMQSIKPRGAGGPDLQPFWRHAIAAAVCARELAPHLRLNPDQAYTAGLLHDIGQLVLVSQFWPAYVKVVDYRTLHECGAVEAERIVLGMDHAAVGQLLTHHWKFPAHLQFAVGMHHATDVPDAEALTLVVMAADAIAHTLDLPQAPANALLAMAPQLWTRLGVSEALLLQVLARVEKQFSAASQILAT